MTDREAQIPAGPSFAGRRPFFDWVAIGMSCLCLIHCLALPVVLAFLPSLSVTQQWPEEVHIVAAALACVACVAAIVPRWKSLMPRRRRVIGVSAALGLACLLTGLLVHHHLAETVITVVGGLLLINAHIQNLRA